MTDERLVRSALAFCNRLDYIYDLSRAMVAERSKKKRQELLISIEEALTCVGLFKPLYKPVGRNRNKRKLFRGEV